MITPVMLYITLPVDAPIQVMHHIQHMLTTSTWRAMWVAMSEASEGFMPDVLSCDLDGSMGFWRVSEKQDNQIGTRTTVMR